MFTLQMLPAACGDCLWLQYGSPTRFIIIDGGLKETAPILLHRMEKARRESGMQILEIELLVVTHIDNDHIQGVIELLSDLPPWLHIKDIWFNGRPQLAELESDSISKTDERAASALLGGGQVKDEPDDLAFEQDTFESREILGPREGDMLSELLAATGVSWNQHPLWSGQAIVVPPTGLLPSVELDGGLRLTLLGPSHNRLHRIWRRWRDMRDGIDRTARDEERIFEALLGRQDTWPPVWVEGERRDNSAANGSSITLLAELDGHAVILAGDAYAPDIVESIQRLQIDRGCPGNEFTLSAFKLPHHASARNLTRALLEKISCSRFLVSTDGSGHGHPDHQALLRILKFSRCSPELMFNYLCETTRRWGDSKLDVVSNGFQDYQSHYPAHAADGFILNLE